MLARPGSRSSPGVAVGISIAVVALGGLAGLQYRMPDGFENPAGANLAGVRQFAEALGIAGIAPVGIPTFVWSFRLLLLAAWVGYLTAVGLAWIGEAPAAKRIFPLVVGMSVAFAIFCPPSLSRDAYAYAAFGRMGGWYARNPYLHTLASFAREGDAAAAFHPIDASSTYGPVWTLFTCGLAAAVRPLGLMAEVVALKLLAASAGVVITVAGRAIARVYAPERADLTTLAIGLNPLLLLEGAGNAHNDFAMVALLFVALALHARGRPWSGYAALGISAGVKFVPLALGPWLLLEQISGRRPREAAGIAALALALVLAPTVVAYAPFWSGAATFEGIQRVVALQSDAGAPPDPSLLRRLAPAAFLYLGLTVWVARSRARGRYSAPWVIFAFALPFLAMPSWFAWYLSWSCLLSLTRWDRLHGALSLAGAAMSMLILSMYALPLSP